MIMLELTQEQAEVLREVCSMIAGHPTNSGRVHMDSISELLEEAGIHSSFALEDKYPSEGRIEFFTMGEATAKVIALHQSEN